jgi:hypothetical protein
MASLPSPGDAWPAAALACKTLERWKISGQFLATATAGLLPGNNSDVLETANRHGCRCAPNVGHSALANCTDV